MSASEIPPADVPRMRRGEVVVCVVGPGDPGDALASVRAHTPNAVPVLVCEDGLSPDPAVGSAAPADVALVATDHRVGPHWLERLVAAARADAGLATASAVTVGEAGDAPLGALKATPGNPIPLQRLSAPRGGCVLVRRSGLELAGEAGALDPGGRIGADFADRCAHKGLAHVLVPDVVVVGPTEDGPEWAAQVAVARARTHATRGRLRVGVDLRMLAGTFDGTRVHAVELVAALARTGHVAVTALTGELLDAATRVLLSGIDGVEVATLRPGAPPSQDLQLDIVHRPAQLSSAGDLALLTALAPRLVITHQDLITYHSHGYFPSNEAWEGYRRQVREALAVADHVVFESEHVQRGALADGLVEAARTSVVPIGVDHLVTGAAGQMPVAPPPLAGLDAAIELVVCLGTDYWHKNRLFALAVVEQLQRRFGWRGRLVFAGGWVSHGSSRAAERDFLAERPALREAVFDLGPISEAEKVWLLERCALVLYPTVQEGFGLVPFEAAAHGRPCLWAAASSLAEVLPAPAAGIIPWSAAATAERAQSLMRDPTARDALLVQVCSTAAQLTWERAATRLLEVYARVCWGPPSPVAAAARAGGSLGGRVSEDAMRLVGPDGLVPGELERPLLALFSRPRLAAPAAAILRALYTGSQRRRRSG